MKSIIKISFLLTLSLLITCAPSNAPSETVAASLTDSSLPSLKGKKILMVYGGWKGHKPKEFTEKVNAFLQKEGAIVTTAEGTEIYADEVVLSSYDLIIQSITMDKIKKEEIQGLVKAVQNGVGFAGAHGGFCDSFRDNTQYQYMTGGQFVSHPGGQINYTVDIIDTNDPVTADMTSFSIKTEQYYVHIDPNVKVLATSTFTGEHHAWLDGAVMPVVWKKYFGKGRIFCITLGHDPSEFDQAAPKTLLMNGLRWASGSKYLPQEKWLSPIYSAQ